VPWITTAVPTGPFVGLKEVMVGGWMTSKLPELVAVPATVVTVIRPEVAPAGTEVLILVLETTSKLALVPLKRTLVAAVKFVPLITTAVPTGPLAGEKEVMVGGWMTLKSPELDAVPAAVVTEILPEVAPAGTVALI
jgi:hypothetical protein